MPADAGLPPGSPMRRVLLVGASVRAIAESAARAGWEAWALDSFGDLDLRRIAHVVSPRGDPASSRTPARVARAARELDVAAVVYAGGWENHPAAVRAVARGRELLGNAPDVLARVRDPAVVARTLRAASLPTPAVWTRREPPRSRGEWMLKRRGSAGGWGVARWRAGSRVRRDAVLQERIEGTPASIVFAADGRDAVPLALTRQLIGDPALGASGFRYCGSILADADDGSLGTSVDRAAAVAVARELTRAFGLVGVNGVDLIVRDGVPFAVEVNPRWTASMELVERARGLAVFETHVRACRGVLPRITDGAWELRGSGAIGKAVVFARSDVVMGDTRRWLDEDMVRDIPHPGERIARGRPVCTVFARGRTAGDCEAALLAAAAQVRRAIEREGRAA